VPVLLTGLSTVRAVTAMISPALLMVFAPELMIRATLSSPSMIPLAPLSRVICPSPRSPAPKITSLLVRVAAALAPRMVLAAALVSSSLPPPERVAPPAAMTILGLVARMVSVRVIVPPRATVAPLMIAEVTDRVVPVSVSEPPSKSTVPAPARVPSKTFPVPAKLISSPPETDSVPPVWSQTPA
jgi:hypothetical protein